MISLVYLPRDWKLHMAIEQQARFTVDFLCVTEYLASINGKFPQNNGDFPPFPKLSKARVIAYLALRQVSQEIRQRRAEKQQLQEAMAASTKAGYCYIQQEWPLVSSIMAVI